MHSLFGFIGRFIAIAIIIIFCWIVSAISIAIIYYLPHSLGWLVFCVVLGLIAFIWTVIDEG